LLKPEDQLNLTEAELKEEITRILKANNPNAPQNIVRYSHKELAYKLAPHVEQLAIHFQIDGNLIHKESEEAKRQLATASMIEPVDIRDPTPVAVNKGTGDGEDYYDVGKVSNKKPTNQFNYSERASQTNNNPLRDRTTMTEPPPRVNFSANANQWEIFDAYQEDFEENQKKQEKIKPSKTKKPTKNEASSTHEQSDDLLKATKSAKILERMVNQNTFDEIAQDFKYYEDDADEFREQEGTLLPLWKFTYEKSKKLSVTSLAWNRKYVDLFAVAYGSCKN